MMVKINIKNMTKSTSTVMLVWMEVDKTLENSTNERDECRVQANGESNLE